MSSPDSDRPGSSSAGEPDRDPDSGGEIGILRLYELLVESVSDYAIFVLDPDGRVASWNAGAERIKGYTADEVIGHHYRMFFPEPAREARDPDVQLEVAARRGRFEAEGWRVRKDGSRFWAHVVLTALYSEGELVGYGKVTGDMTAERAAQRALAQRERQLEEAQEIAHLGSWEYAPGTGAVSWSEELYRIFGLDPSEELTYERYLELLHPDDRDEVRRKVRATLENEEPYVHEHRIRRPDGEVRWVQSRGTLVTSEKGHPQLLGTSLDITELKESEERARRLAGEKAARQEAERTAQRMGFLAEASALLSASFDYRQTLETVSWLAVPSFADWAAVDMLDPEGELRRLAVAHMDAEHVELAKELHESYPPDRNADYGATAVIRSGEAELHEEIDPEVMQAVARDERHLELLRELQLESAMIVPIRVRDRALGAITFVYSESGRRYTGDDLVVAQELANRAGLAVENAQLHDAERDAREHAERAEERTRRLQTITADLSEAVTPEAVARVMVDHGAAALEAASGSLVLVRAKGGLEMVRSIGLPDEVVDAYSSFDTGAGLPLAEAVRTGALILVRDAEERDERFPDIAAIQPLTRTEALVAVPLPSGAGIIGSLGFGYHAPRDFSPEEQEFLKALGRQCAQALERAWLYETEHMAREAAEEASQAKSQFVAMVSHELRTPLSAIIGYQELLSEEVSGTINDQQKEQLARIRSAATHLRDLINQILSLSRIEAGKEEVEWEVIDAGRLAAEVADLMEQEISESDLRLETRLEGVDAEVETDPGKLRQILLNLVSNAIKFTPSGTITIGARAAGEGEREVLEIYVRDTGVGIAKKDRERIFEPFTQVDQTMTRAVGGSGLGLAVSRRLAALIGGSIELDTEPGGGSTFMLRLPR